MRKYIFPSHTSECTFPALFLCTALLAGCETTPIKVEELAINAPAGLDLPIKAQVQLNVEPPEAAHRTYTVRAYQRLEYTLPEGQLMLNAATKVLKRLFSDVRLSGTDRANLVIYIAGQGQADWVTGIHSAKATVHIKQPGGAVVGNFDGSASAWSKDVADPLALENAFIKAFSDIADRIVKDKNFRDLARKGFGPPVAIVTEAVPRPKVEAQKPAPETKAAAKETQPAIALMHKGNFLVAAGELIQAAKRGDATAQTFVGRMYLGDLPGLIPDVQKAIYWFQQAAQQNFAEADYQLATMYDYGKGIGENDALSFKWYKQAAELGHAGAQNNLGTQYFLGKGVSRNYGMAERWYRESAYQGYREGQFNLGAMYASDQYDHKDLVGAYVWSDLAAKQGHKDADRNRNITLRKLSAAQLVEAKDMIKKISENIVKSEATLIHEKLKSIFSVFEASGHVQNERHRFNGFISALPPDWPYGFMTNKPSKKTEVSEATFVMFENRNPCDDCWSLAAISLAKLEDQNITNSSELLRFVQHTSSEGGSLYLPYQSKKETVLDFEYWEDDRANKICVQYTASSKSQFELFRTHLKYYGRGFVCVHPYAPSVAVLAIVVQRYQKRIGAETKQRLNTRANQFLDAVEFTPLE